MRSRHAIYIYCIIDTRRHFFGITRTSSVLLSKASLVLRLHQSVFADAS